MITINKTQGKDFLLLNLSDPQLSDAEWAPEHENRKILTMTITELVNRIHPDLITISGDIAWSENLESYHQFGILMDSFGIPWTCCWGNHDNQSGPQTINKIVDEYMTRSYFIYEKGEPLLGNGNFVIRIEENGSITEGIIIMDSHDRMPYTDENGETSDSWAKFTSDQLAWYEEQVRSLQAEGCNDTTVITHIPIYAYRTAFDEAFRIDVDQGTVDPQNSSGPTFWNPGFEDSFGVNYEGIGSYPEDEGMLTLMEKLKSTKHFIAGHDHVNNFVIKYHGIKLIFSLKTGAGSYWEPKLNGGTVLRISEYGVEEVYHEYCDPFHFTT